MKSQNSILPVDDRERFFLQMFGRSFSLSERTALLVILTVSLVLRFLSALYQGNTVADLPGVYDQISYEGLARRVVEGYGFSFAEDHWPATRGGEPTAHWSYLYTLFIAAIYKIFGMYPLAARLIQALIVGVLHPLLVWRISNRLFNWTVGLVAAALTSIYIYFFYYTGALVTESFYILGILWIFDVSLRLSATCDYNSSKPVHWLWLELGFAIGVTVLFRQVFFLFLPFLYVWLWLRVLGNEASGWQQRLNWSALKGLTLATIVLILLISPWTYRNQKAFGTFVLLNTNAGFAFFWGNHPVHGDQFMPLLPGGAQQYYDLIPKELLPLNEAELDKALLKLGLRFIVDDPTRFLLLSASRAEEYFKFWPSPDSGLVSNISRVGSFGIYLPFFLYGLWVAFAQTWKISTMSHRWNLGLLLLFILVYTSVHLFSWTLIRYRLPVDALLILFAALGIEYLFIRNHSSEGKPTDDV